MESRRSFLKTTAAAGAALIFCPASLHSRILHTGCDGFALHPFIEANPDAVFILKTSVDVKTNAEAMKYAGLGFGRSVFIAKSVSEGGIPITNRIAIKPNLTCRDRSHPSYTVERSMGIVTDAYFVEGLIESVKELGLSGSQFYLREVNCPADFQDGGYWAMAARTEADIRDMSAPVGSISENDLVWVDVPEGVWFRKIPYLWPINAPDTFLLNIAKLKTHHMGMTLAAKNLQGTIAHYYQAHCKAYDQNMNISASHVSPMAKADILANYNRHVAAGIPRWDRPGSMGGIWMETWGSRCLDNNMVTQAGLHIVEGVYGRDGHFIDGPSPEGLATDYMTNVVLFGKNAFNVDVVGCWLGGHEPGNFGLFHMAIERGLATTFNPSEVPVYEWSLEGSATLTTLAAFPRTQLKTLYLRRDYDGQSEERWHLVDEFFDYGATALPRTDPSRPDLIVLSQNYPNPFNSSTSIQFILPESGHVRIEVCDVLGQVMDVLAEGRYGAGSHLVAWNSGAAPTGVYFCRMLTGGAMLTRRMVLVR